MFGPEIQRLARALVQWLLRPLASSPVTPNMLTVLGLLLSGVTAVVLGGGHMFLGGLMVLVAGACDMLDGGLARAKNMQSTFGAFYDSTLDRLSESIVCFGLAYWFLMQGMHTAVLLVFVVIVGSLLISYARARAEGLGVECKVGMLARPERVVLLGAALILEHFVRLPGQFGILQIVLAALAVFSFFTLGHRIWHVWKITTRSGASGVHAQAAPTSQRFWQRRTRA
jgi:CDP-diacylglycerol---glycerol-3-phosphate 3-phosphatidyltransferase